MFVCLFVFLTDELVDWDPAGEVKVAVPLGKFWLTNPCVSIKQIYVYSQTNHVPKLAMGVYNLFKH